jgi:MFS family permease
LNSIVIKLAPKEDAIVFLTAKSITLAIAGAVAPILAGILGDFFANQQFVWEVYWSGPHGKREFKIIELQHFRFLFLIGSILAIGALQLLKLIKEEGEVDKNFARSEIRRAFRNNIMETMTQPAVRLVYQPYTFTKIIRRRIRYNIERLKKITPFINREEDKEVDSNA